MKRDKILEELLEQNLDIPKQKMENILNVLLESNPDVKIDKDFKKKLKLRLESIWNFEKKRDPLQLFFFWIPIAWIIWVFAFFWYFYWGVWNFNFDSTNIDSTSSPANFEITEKEFYESQAFKDLLPEIQPVKMDPRRNLSDSSDYLDREAFEKSVKLDATSNPTGSSKDDFKDKCLEKWYKYSQTDSEESCTFKEKICKKIDFEKGKCDFLN